jgi:hypothetical protein
VAGARIEGSAPPHGPTAPPGDYTLRLTVDGHTSVQALKILPDPRTSFAPDDLRAEVRFALMIGDEMTKIADMVGTIRDLRGQLTALDTRLKAAPEQSDLIDLGRTIVARLDAIEETIHNPHAEVEYDILAGRHGGTRLYSRLNSLLDAANGHDGPPTQGMLEVADVLQSDLRARQGALDELISGDLGRFNRIAREQGLPYVGRGGVAVSGAGAEVGSPR